MLAAAVDLRAALISEDDARRAEGRDGSARPASSDVMGAFDLANATADLPDDFGSLPGDD